MCKGQYVKIYVFMLKKTVSYSNYIAVSFIAKNILLVFSLKPGRSTPDSKIFD